MDGGDLKVKRPTGYPSNPIELKAEREAEPD